MRSLIIISVHIIKMNGCLLFFFIVLNQSNIKCPSSSCVLLLLKTMRHPRLISYMCMYVYINTHIRIMFSLYVHVCSNTRGPHGSTQAAHNIYNIMML